MDKIKLFLKNINKKIQQNSLTPAGNRKKVGIILFYASIAIFMLFAVRLTYVISVGKVGTGSLDAERQKIYQGSSVIKAKRGTIYDRNGQPLAEDAASYSLYAELSKDYIGINGVELYVHDDDHEQIADILNKYTGMDKKLVLEQLTPKKNDSGKPINTVEFGSKGKNLSLETKTKIEEALEKEKITGIYFKEHPDRMYPNGNFASYFIGYAQPENTEAEDSKLSGKNGMGIENAYDEVLRGTDGFKYFQKDSKGNELPGSEVVEQEALDGQDIYTTFDSNLQVRLEDVMDSVFEKAHPEDMTAILMEAKTGDILAASQRPSFDPQTKEGLVAKKEQPDPVWENLLVQRPYEPGSTIKPFTVAAAIDSGNYDANATFNSGRMDLYDATISDWIPDGKGPLTYRQALSWSSNVGMVLLEQKMGNTWLEYLQRFGFGHSTESGLPLEAPGDIRDKNAVDTAMTAFGQAISVTNLQMMQAYTALTNEGKMLRPRYIKQIIDSEGNEKEIPVEVVGEPIKASTAKTVLEYMQDTVTDEVYGTGYGIYNIEGVNVSAKTGTAQIFENGQLLTGANDYIYSVVQVAPTEDPEYIMYVTMKKPVITGEYGSPSELISEISNGMLKHAFKVDTTTNEGEE